jgi:hypothetical protein
MFADDLTKELISDCSSNHVEGLKNWIVGLNSEDSVKFRKRKLEIMPNGTNAQFINALLLVREGKLGIIDNHVLHHFGIGVTQNDNNRMLDNSILKDIPSKIEKRKITTSPSSYKINGVELLLSPTLPSSATEKLSTCAS